MIDLKRFVLLAVLILSMCLISACSNTDKSVDYDVIAKAESGDAGTLTNSARHITDKEMLRMAAEQTDVELDAGTVNFDESHIFQISLYENGCGYLLEDFVETEGVLQFMFELTPVVENGEDPEDVICSETMVPTTFFIKTDAVDFSSLEIYSSGKKIQSE